MSTLTDKRPQKMPKWLTERIPVHGAYWKHEYLCRIVDGWLDHWGSAKNTRGERVLYTEPYGLSNRGMISLINFQLQFNCVADISGPLNHNDGCTHIELRDMRKGEKRYLDLKDVENLAAHVGAALLPPEKVRRRLPKTIVRAKCTVTVYEMLSNSAGVTGVVAALDQNRHRKFSCIVMPAGTMQTLRLNRDKVEGVVSFGARGDLSCDGVPIVDSKRLDGELGYDIFGVYGVREVES